MMKIKHIIWDWNGTLLRDFELSLEAVNLMLKDRLMPSMTAERYKESMCTPITGFYEKNFDMSRDTFDTLIHDYHKYYNILEENKKRDEEVMCFLEKVEKAGFVQTLLSASRNQKLLYQAEKYGVKGFMTYISGADDNDYSCASKTDRARELIRLTGISNEETVIVGDTDNEIGIARELNTKSITISWGHGKVNPDVYSFDELYNMLMSM